jgi:hypothetical protein
VDVTGRGKWPGRDVCWDCKRVLTEREGFGESDGKSVGELEFTKCIGVKAVVRGRGICIGFAISTLTRDLANEKG